MLKLRRAFACARAAALACAAAAAPARAQMPASPAEVLSLSSYTAQALAVSPEVRGAGAPA